MARKASKPKRGGRKVELPARYAFAPCDFGAIRKGQRIRPDQLELILQARAGIAPKTSERFRYGPGARPLPVADTANYPLKRDREEALRFGLRFR